MSRSTPLLLACVVALGLSAPAFARPVGADDPGAVFALTEESAVNTWPLLNTAVLDYVRPLNPASSGIRCWSVVDGNPVGLGEPVRLVYAGLDRAYVTIFRYRPSGTVEVAMANQYFSKMESPRWYLDVRADSTEGAETFLSVTTRNLLSDDQIKEIAQTPDRLELSDNIVGSSFGWYLVKIQQGLDIETNEPDYYEPAPNNPYASNQQPIDSALMNPYAAQGGITVTEGNPYYVPPQRGAYLYNPFVQRYGYLPYYAPFPFSYGPGGIVRPVIDYGNAFYAPNVFYYVIPGTDGVRTNFYDLLFNADLQDGRLFLRGANDFVEGEFGLEIGAGGPGFSLRLSGVRDRHGNRYSRPPIIVIIDGNPYTPLVDPNTGDYIVPVPMPAPGGHGSRIRIQQTEFADEGVGIGGIEIVPN